MPKWHEPDSKVVAELPRGDVVKGLTAAEATRRLGEYGRNELQTRGTRRAWLILWEQLSALMVLILIAAPTQARWETGMILKEFIMAQPASVHIAVGYIRNNSGAMAQDFTTNHDQAAKALRMPMGVAALGSSPILERWICSSDGHNPRRAGRFSLFLSASIIFVAEGRNLSIPMLIL